MLTQSSNFPATPTGEMPIVSAAPVAHSNCGWNYDEAFCRNRGLFSKTEQETLRNSHIAIPGLGGVGGVHLMTLARMGIGNFSIADADDFGVSNFNRQYGANTETVGKKKTDVMSRCLGQVNPQANLRCFESFIDEVNVGEFLDGVDILVDSVDFFSFDARRMLFNEARKRGIWTITAGPIGFSAAWLVFDPNGMSFDEYFDVQDCMSQTDKLLSFAVGLAPKATQRHYMELKNVRLDSGAAPSCALACQLASGVAAAEVTKILLGRGEVRPAPWYSQFDAYTQQLKSKRLRGGNRHPIQRIKKALLKKMLTRAEVI